MVGRGRAINWTPQLIVIVALVFLLGLLPAVSIVRGESRTLEFKSTVRMNLKTQKFGKEIELAWLKGATAFMNYEAGTLLIGVGDDGEILGVGQDGFENDDRCKLHLKNLVNQHVGAEFSPLIRFHVKPIAAKLVVAVQCERSSDPVFLKGKNKETFYIRSGPSSVELSSREVLEYVARRA